MQSTGRSLVKQNLDRTWFTDEHEFTIQTLSNVKKSEVSAEPLVKGRKHFSQSVLVYVVVTKLGKTDLVFVQPGADLSDVQ